MSLEQLLYVIVILLLVGVGLHFLRRTQRIDGTVKTLIYIIVFVAVAIWIVTKVLPAAGLGG